MRTSKFNKKKIIQNYFLEKNINSNIVLGTWKLGGYNFGKYHEKDALETLSYSFDNNIRCFDIASFYAKGNSNIVLKKFLKTKKRSDYILCAKVGLEWDNNKVVFDGSKEKIEQEIAKLQDIFNTPYIDMLLLHWPDPTTLLSESLESLINLRSENKIKFTGICNINTEQLIQIKPFDLDIVHVENNVFENNNQNELIQTIKKTYFLAIFSIFKNGLLASHNYQSLLSFGKKDYRRKKMNALSLEMKEKLNTLYSKDTNGFTYAECVFAWSLENLNYHSMIIGPKNLNQIKKLLNLYQNSNNINDIKSCELYQFLNAFKYN